MMNRKLLGALGIAGVLALSGCFDSDSGNNNKAEGKLLIPAGTGGGGGGGMTPLGERPASQRPTAGGSISMASANCPDVPGGYEPLANATIEFLDSSDVVVGEPVDADECGEFSTNPPADAVAMRATVEGFRPIETEVSNFRSGGTGFASTIPSTWSYRIGSLQVQGDGRVSFTVVDDQRGMAVIGLPRRAIEALVDDVQVTVSDLTSSAATQEGASVSVVLDASGSMGTGAYTDPDTGESFDRYQLTALATHEFLDTRGPNDEIAFTIFDSSVDMINDDWIENNWTVLNSNGNETNYTFSSSGFTGQDEPLRMITDAFNRYNTIWNSRDTAGTIADEMHPMSPNIQLDGFYDWGGATALYDAVSDSLDLLDAETNDRKILVTMGDGGDNRSSASKQDVIDKANALGIPVLSVGLAVGGTAEDNLRDMGLDTGGDYFPVDDIDIADAFVSIQSGIVFQYLMELDGVNLSAGDVLTVRLSLNGVVVERDYTVPATP